MSGMFGGDTKYHHCLLAGDAKYHQLADRSY